MPDRKRPEDMSAEELIALGFTTTLREHDAVCELRDQYARAALAALPTPPENNA